jgi:hypothetical protein
MHDPGLQNEGQTIPGAQIAAAIALPLSARFDQTMEGTVKATAARRPAARVTISARFLLAIYAIVPLCLVAMILDRLVWGGTLFRALPTSPESFFIFQLAFGTPHIIASTILLAANTDYLHAYWLRLTLFTLLILAFFGIGSLYIPYNVFLALVGAATVLHVIKQQVGVGKGLCRGAGWLYDLWGWTLVVFGSILYYAVYTGYTFSTEAAAWVHGTLWALAAIALALALICHARIPTRMGRLYLWANLVLTLQSGLFYAEDYSFLAILGPRLVHDVTAFTFYVAHDVNRHGTATQNLLYRLASKLGLGVFWVCPALAILLTFLIGRYLDPLAHLVVPPVLGYDLPYAASFVIVGYLGLLHYYTEAFTWKKGSPYRQYVALSA